MDPGDPESAVFHALSFRVGASLSATVVVCSSCYIEIADCVA